MKNFVVVEKINKQGEPIKYGERLVIDGEKLIGTSTKSLYIRTGKLNGTLFLSQRGNGSDGAGDLCKIGEDAKLEVSHNLFERIKKYALKANAVI